MNVFWGYLEVKYPEISSNYFDGEDISLVMFDLSLYGFDISEPDFNQYSLDNLVKLIPTIEKKEKIWMILNLVVEFYALFL